MRLTDLQRTTLGTMTLGFLFVACAALVNPPYKLLYNPSESAPIGWYAFKSQRDLQVGEYVLVKLPEKAAQLASERGYLPPTVPILKHIGALHGQEVCLQEDLLTIDGILVAHTLEYDGAGRKMPRWQGCQILADDEVFLLSTESPLSFDSRYFGPIKTSAVLGEALPVWIRE